jgi:hypothetical protein
MFPAVQVPESAGIKKPVEVKLKPKWSFDGRRRVFTREDGTEFSPKDVLPKKSRIVYKVPSLAQADSKSLSKDERELRRYLQIILPDEVPPANYLETIRAWPCVEDAHLAPDVSLPQLY